MAFAGLDDAAPVLLLPASERQSPLSQREGMIGRMGPHLPPTMNICGRDLRYVLMMLLWDHGGVLTVADLVRLVEGGGFALSGRPSKTVSDALRWEVRKGRVRRAGRSRYAPGRIPRSTIWWIRRHLESIAA